MKMEKLIELALSSERVPVDVAHELCAMGITEFIKAGLTYDQAIDILVRSEIALSRETNQDASFVPKVDASVDAEKPAEVEIK